MSVAGSKRCCEMTETSVPALALRLDDLVGLLDRHLGRLLDDDVLAGRERLLGDHAVQPGRACRRDHVDLLGRQGVGEGGVRPAAALGGQRLGARQVDVDDGDELDLVTELGHHLAVLLADDSGADDGERGPVVAVGCSVAHAYSIPSFCSSPVKAACARVKSSGPEKPPSAWTSPRCGSREKNPSKPSSRKRPDGLDQLAVAVAGDRHGPVGRVGVLDLHVLEVRTQRRVPLGEGADPDLDEVRRVPRHPQVRRPDRLDDVEAALRDVAVDLLLVLVHEDDPGGLADVGERTHTAEHLVAVVLRVVTGSDEEREQPDVRRTKGFRHIGRVPSTLEVRLEVLVDEDLPDRRADAGDLETVPVQRLLHRRELGVVEVEDVDAPGAADLDVGSGRDLPPPSTASRSPRRSRRRIRTESTWGYFTLPAVSPPTR